MHENVTYEGTHTGLAGTSFGQVIMVMDSLIIVSVLLGRIIEVLGSNVGCACLNVLLASADHWRKGFPYEFASHVPWMMRWPKNAGQMGQSRAEHWKRGVVIEDAVVELRDIFPTMLDAIGALDITCNSMVLQLV